MYRGETITTALTGLPIPVSEIRSLYIVFHTFTKTILEKTLDDCVLDHEANVVECKITQEESLRFGCGPVFRSAIVLTKDGARFERRDVEMICGQTAKSEVMT